MNPTSMQWMNPLFFTPSLRNPRQNGNNVNGAMQNENVNGAENNAKLPDGTLPQIGGNNEQGIKLKNAYDRNECQTCKNRRYQDQSDDPGVSMQTPTKLSPTQAAVAVRSHEGEHVTREQAKAERDGRKVVSQSVTYHGAFCPECGKFYIAGGTTRTVTANDNTAKDKFSAGMEDANAPGQTMDKIA